MQNFKFRMCDGSQKDFDLLRKIQGVTMYEPFLKTVGEWDEHYQLERVKYRWHDAFPTLHFLMDGDREIGTINFWKKPFDDGVFDFIEQVYLLPEYQGRGLGKKMMEHFLKLGVPVRLSVLSGDRDRMMFYRKFGFKPFTIMGIRTYFHYDPALPVEKNLNQITLANWRADIEQFHENFYRENQISVAEEWKKEVASHSNQDWEAKTKKLHEALVSN